MEEGGGLSCRRCRGERGQPVGVLVGIKERVAASDAEGEITGAEDRDAAGAAEGDIVDAVVGRLLTAAEEELVGAAEGFVRPTAERKTVGDEREDVVESAERGLLNVAGAELVCILGENNPATRVACGLSGDLLDL